MRHGHDHISQGRRGGTSTPSGYRRTTYSATEVDAVAIYSPATDACYLIPIEQAAGRKTISLRLEPSLNRQTVGIHWARDYELARSLEHHWSDAVDGPARIEDATALAVG
jgi:PD-(D/E)XK endonuclease